MSKVGQSAWAVDLDAAHTFAIETIDRVAAARGWSAEWRKWAVDEVNAAMHTADGWFTDDVAGFWQALTDKFAAASLVEGAPVGLDKLSDAWASAVATSGSSSEARRANSPTGLAADTVEASAADVSEVVVAGAKAAGSVGRAFKGRAAWYGLGALVAVALGLRLRGR